ncbi:uncharacterized protein Hap1MRO34_009409 [Clarias gariepinus]
MLKCSSFSIQISNTEAHVYLCKNGVGERLDVLENKEEFIFTMRNISLRDSGNYSCMYSFTKYHPRKVTGYGNNSIHVQVTEYPEKNITGSGHNSNSDQKSGDSLEIFPAQIFGPRTAKVGENLILKCSFSNIKISNTEAHVYLCKNGVGKRLDLLGNKDECTFTLRNIALRDSGNYSCMYSFTKYPPRNVTGYGINSIHVQVTEYHEKNIRGSGHNSIPDQESDPQLEKNVIRLIFSVGVIAFACYIVIFDIKSRLQPDSKAKDRNIQHA